MIFGGLGLLFFLVNIASGAAEGIIIGVVLIFIGLVVEIPFDIKFFSKSKSTVSGIAEKAKENKELRELEKEVKKERLKKELAELKQQNSN